nr:reverse transcriptase domain-containing protein [Tanacetum cinerariifolium]
MRTRSRSRHKIVEPLRIEFHSQEDQFQEDPPVATMTDNRTMAKMLRAPTEGYEEAIVVPPILAEQFELKHSLINMMTSEQCFGLEKDNPHDHIRAARRWLEKEPMRSITTWEDLVSKFINEFFPPLGLLVSVIKYQILNKNSLNTFYNALNPTGQDSLNDAAGGNLLERSTQDVLTIIENKSKVRNSRSKSITSQVKAYDTNSSSEIAKLTHAVNEQTSAMTTAMTAMLRQFQATPPPASVKAVEETCVTCGGAHPYYQCLATGGNTFPKFRDNIQEYGSAAAANYNQGNPGYRPQGVANQIRPPDRHGENELRNEMKTSIQTSLSNQTNEIRDMMASFLRMNTASPSSSGTIPSNTVANPKSDLKSITTRSEVSYDGPSISPPVVENAPEATKDTVTPTNNGNTKDVQPQAVSSKPPVSTSEPANTPISASKPNLQASIPYPSRRNDERNREKAKDQIEKFYQLFKDMSFKISFTDALIIMPKFASTLKALISNKEKLSEMARTPLNERCSAEWLNV